MKQPIQMFGGMPAYWCPVCGHPHCVAVDAPFPSGARWQWNRDMDKPTFHPSIHVNYTVHEGFRLERPGKVGELRWETFEEAQAAAVEAGLGPQWQVRPCPERTVTCCHVWVKEGNIHILNDSSRLGGMVQALQPWDVNEYEENGRGPD